jgi:hypothetical protein
MEASERDMGRAKRSFYKAVGERKEGRKENRIIDTKYKNRKLCRWEKET